MIFFVVFLFAFCDAKPGYSDSSLSGNDIGQEGTNSYGSGYAGSFSGSNNDGFPSGNIPSFIPFIPQFDFSSFFQQLNRQHQEFIQHGNGAISFSVASANPGSIAQAKSSIIFPNRTTNFEIQKLAQGNQGQAVTVIGSNKRSGTDSKTNHKESPTAIASIPGGGFGLGNRGSFVGGYGGGFTGPDGNSFGFSGPLGDAAFASGSIGPGGGHQIASVFPENPTAPNINTRFNGGLLGGNNNGGEGDFKSVFTSSKSVSTNVGGKPQTFKEASTTINDNGKVTTYTAHNP